MERLTGPIEFPVYIPTRGRPNKQLTANALLDLGISPYLVVEAAEEEAYKAANPKCKVIVWPQRLMDEYEKTPELDPHPTTGVAHNYAWEHSREMGYTHHWIMDDNIRYFFIKHNGRRARMANAKGLQWNEDFIRKFKNLAGISLAMSPFMGGSVLCLNTRLYCAVLYRNDLHEYGIKWRRGLNDDTIVSLDILKTGYWCTAENRAIGIAKLGTSRKGRLEGGMTDFYAQGGFIKKSAELVRLHPDCTKTVIKFDRVHHTVDFSQFKQKLIPVDAPTPKAPVKQTKNPLQKGIDIAVGATDNPKAVVRYPIYVLSKGRAGTMTTGNLLSGLPYYLVVEKEEAADYAKHYPDATLLILPESNKGAPYVRNFMKQHSKDNGDAYHWQLDDDIKTFSLRYNKKNNPHSAAEVFNVAESVVDLYANVEAASLMNDAYAFSASAPVLANQFVNRAMLLKTNDFQFQSNIIDDLDYALQILDSGACTLRFTTALIKTNIAKQDDTSGMGIEWRKKSVPWDNLISKWTFLSPTIDKQGLPGIKPVRLAKHYPQQPVLKADLEPFTEVK